MTTTFPHCWAITAIGSTTAYDAGRAGTVVEAWTCALRAGRAALLAKHLGTLAVAIDGELEALYDPGRDRAGRLDPAQVTHDLVVLHQDVTAPQVVDLLTAPADPTPASASACAGAGGRRPAPHRGRRAQR